MRAKEAAIGAGAFMAGAAILTHGALERFSDRSAAFDKRDSAYAIIQNAVKQYSPENPPPQKWEDIPPELRTLLEKANSDYWHAQDGLDVLDGETIEFSTRQAKASFNFAEIVLGLGTVAFVGVAGHGSLGEVREKRRTKKWNEEQRLQRAIEDSFPFQEAAGRSKTPPRPLFYSDSIETPKK